VICYRRAIRETEPSEFRNDGARLFRVLSIPVAEGIEHHLFLGRYAQDVKENEDDQADGTGKPVLQKQDLGDDPKPLTGIHRVPDLAVYSAGHQDVSLEDFKCGRPVGLQIQVGPCENEYGAGQEKGSDPTHPGGQEIICKSQPARYGIDQGEEEPCNRQRSE